MPLSLEEAIDFIDYNSEETGSREILEIWNGADYKAIDIILYSPGCFNYHFFHEKTRNWYGKLEDIETYMDEIPDHWADYNEDGTYNYNQIKFLPCEIIELTFFEKFTLKIKLCPEVSMNAYILDSNGDDSDPYFIILVDIMKHFPKEHYVDLIPHYDFGDEDEEGDE